MSAILRGAGYQIVTALVVIKRLSSMGAMTPLVVVSEANRQRAVEAGADAFLLKPLDQATFLAAVKGALGEAEVPAPAAPPESGAASPLP